MFHNLISSDIVKRSHKAGSLFKGKGFIPSDSSNISSSNILLFTWFFELILTSKDLSVVIASIAPVDGVGMVASVE